MVTCGSEKEAQKISEILVKERAAACASISNVSSFFIWRGNPENKMESLLIIKTIESKYNELEHLVRINHSYECPEIIAIEVSKAYHEYGDWVNAFCKNEIS